MFTVHLGPRPAVMLCGAETIREALVDQADSFSGRGMIATIESTFQGYGEHLKGTVVGQDGGGDLAKLNMRKEEKSGEGPFLCTSCVSYNH